MALIPVMLDGKLSEMAEADLLKLEGGFADDNEITTWVQYHLPRDGSMVHRSAHVRLQDPVVAEGAAADMG
jgi:hypothetical protein